MGFFTQQAEQSLERGKGLEAMPGVFGPLKVLVACQQQSGYGISCQHLHNPHCNPMLCLSCAVLGPYLCHAMLCHTKLLTPCWVTQYCTVLMCPGLSHALMYVKTILNTPPAQSGGASALLRSRAESTVLVGHKTQQNLCKHINRLIMKAQPVCGVTNCISLSSLLQAMLSAQERDLPG